MKTTANKWMLRSLNTHEMVTDLPAMTKGRLAKILKNSGRTDLEMVQVNW